MGGAGRLCFLRRRSGGARRQGAGSVPQRLPRDRVARLLDPGADRRGERDGPRGRGRKPRGATGRALRRARPRDRAPCRRRGVRLRGVAHRSSARYADRDAPRARGRRHSRDLPHAQAARRAEAAAGVFVPRSRGRTARGDRRTRFARARAQRGAMKDFWLSCGHHLLDRDAGGGLVATDEFLKAYLARPELAPPPEACAVERTLHAALLAEPRRPVAASDIAASADADARENWHLLIDFRDHLLRHPTLEAAYLAFARRRGGARTRDR